jgi:hypothetical protein
MWVTQGILGSNRAGNAAAARPDFNGHGLFIGKHAKGSWQ